MFHAFLPLVRTLKVLPKISLDIFITCPSRLFHMPYFYPFKTRSKIYMSIECDRFRVGRGTIKLFPEHSSILLYPLFLAFLSKRRIKLLMCSPLLSFVLPKSPSNSRMARELLALIHRNTISFPKSLQQSAMSSSANTRAMSLAPNEVYIKTGNLAFLSLSLTRKLVFNENCMQHGHGRWGLC